MFLILIAALCLVACERNQADRLSGSNALFTLMDNQKTGVDFINSVEDQKDFNILSYRNFYNGGGVSVGDINNDGLPELFFVSNQNPNRLYLNKGNWIFEDITEQAGVAGTGTTSLSL